MSNDSKYVILDLSCFTSNARLHDMLSVLDTARKTVAFKTNRFVMPSLLYAELRSLARSREVSEKLVKLFQAWLPFYARDHLVELIKGISADPDYVKHLRGFFQKYAPVPAGEYIGNIDRIGEQTLSKERLLEQLGTFVGSVVFEILAVSHKLKAVIISFGERFANLVKITGITLKRIPSSYKKMLKHHAKIRRALRLMGIILSVKMAREMISALGLSDYPHLDVGDIGIGVLLIADG